MAEYELLLPKMGESVAEATIIKWNRQPGDAVKEDDEIVQIATDKVDSDVPSPVKGILKRQLCKENDVVRVGEVIAIIETAQVISSSDPSDSIEEAPDEEVYADEFVADEIPGIDYLNTVAKDIGDQTDDSAGSEFYSPLIRSIAAEERISLEELNKIKGTGLQDRVTKQDLLDYISFRNGASNSVVSASEKHALVEEPKLEQKISQSKPVSLSGGDEIIEMDRMRRLIAEHMVMSKQISPHVNSFVEVDVTNLVHWRDKIKASFQSTHGEKVTFTPIFVQVVAKAIVDFPMINVSVNGTQIIKKKNINIGMATALPSGNLIVPVIKNADQLSLPGLAKSVNDLANRARANKLRPDDVQDGTFTITNIGSFGNTMGTPIINQPQVAVIAFGVIKKKPAVIETNFGDMIGIRHIMILSLAYDHRVVDGALGGMFVKRVADYLENWDSELKV